MTRAAAFKQADATRALKAAVAAGLKPSGYKIEIDGAISIYFDDTPNPARRNPLDRVLNDT